MLSEIFDPADAGFPTCFKKLRGALRGCFDACENMRARTGEGSVQRTMRCCNKRVVAGAVAAVLDH